MSNTVPSEILDEITRDEKDQNEPPKDYTTIIITSSIVGTCLNHNFDCYCLLVLLS